MRLSTLLPVLPLAAATPLGKRAEPAPVIVPRGVSSEHLVPDSYIVKFKEGSPLSALEEAIKLIPGHNGDVFDNVMQGFTSSLDAKLLDVIRNLADVSFQLVVVEAVARTN